MANEIYIHFWSLLLSI